MFDLIAGGPRVQLQQKTPAPLVLSIGGHVVAVTLLIALPLLFATESLPEVPTMMAFVVAAPAPPPPPPPAPPAPAASKPQREVKVAASSVLAAPLEAPAEVMPEPAYTRFGGEGEGVEGGLEGGISGGIVGGLGQPAAPPPPPPPPSPREPAEPVRVGGAVRPPLLVKRVEPDYPPLAQATKTEGMVILEAVVSEDGTVRSVRVLRSILALDKAAIEAVQQWQYEPLLLNGHPTAFVLTVTLSFSLK
jgi:protein TonB